MTPAHEDTPILIPAECERTLALLEADPLEPGPEAEAHLRGCTPCAEARVMLLAQEESSVPLVPAGYFQALPGRVLRKLPAAKTAPRHRLPGWAWGAAAALVMASVGLGGFLAGRANGSATPAVAQTHAEPAEVTVSDRASLPFHDRDEELEDLQSLSPDEMQTLVDRLQQNPPAKR